MKKRYLAPSEVAENTIKSAITKVNLSITRMILLSVLAGIFIGFGAFGDIVVMQTLMNIDVGIMKLLGAFVFPVGLMLVIIAGAELFTGNNLMTMALFNKTISAKGLFKNWTFVYIGNFIGSILLATTIVYSGIVSDNAKALALSIGASKVSLSFSNAIVRGILCNIIVVLAVWMGAAAQDIISRIFATWFPIMLFVLSGFEHCIANMFFLSFAKFLGLNTTWYDIWVSNLIPVTLGNIIGGAIIIPGIYYITYILPIKKS